VSDLGLTEACRHASLGLKLWPDDGKAQQAFGCDVGENAGVGQLSMWYEEHPGYVRYISTNFWPEPHNNNYIASVMPLACPWLLGLYHQGVSAQFDKYERNEIPLATAVAFHNELGAAA
jgi:hypothetical protein